MRLIPGFIPQPEPRGRTGGPFTLFCLAPHGVFPAPSVTLGAVSSYLAISPLPSFARRLERAVSFLRHFPSPCHYDRAPRLSPGMLPCGVRTFLSLPKEAAIISGPFQDGKGKREGRVAQCRVRMAGNQTSIRAGNPGQRPEASRSPASSKNAISPPVEAIHTSFAPASK